MSVTFYMDVHVPQAITDQLRLRGLDVMTAIEDGQAETPDEELLQRATDLSRLFVTQDIRFKGMAQRWQAEGKEFAGLVFGHQLHGTIGQYVKDLELIARASEPDEWLNVVEHLPF